jgi:hypothetical protein
MVHVQEKIATGMDVLAFVTMNDWNFKSDNFQNLVTTQSTDEYSMFPIDTKNLGDSYDYLKISMYESRQYCGQDPLSTIPKAKIIIRM